MKSLIDIAKELKYILCEHAVERSRALNILSSLCWAYTLHIVKLSVFGGTRQHEYATPKWKDEIFNFLQQVSFQHTLKGCKKLKSKDYLDNFFYVHMETEQELTTKFSQILKNFTRQGYVLPNKINYKKIFEGHKTFVNKIVEQLPNTDYDKVISLLDTYIVGKGLEK